MKSKNDLKIGDRVRVVSLPNSFNTENSKIRPGMMGTVKEIIKGCIGIEFDEYMGGHDGNSWLWSGKKGYCWNVTYECLEKIDKMKKEVIEETKAERIGTDKEMINHPPHYTVGKVECIDAIESATTCLQGIEAVCTANIIKYVWRWKLKNGVEDLEKAKWYLNKLIEQAKGEK